MNRLIFATSNEGKLVEIRKVLKDLPFEVLSLRQAGISVDIDENGSTFEENALIKAHTIHDITGGFVMSDDSGICIDYFGGEPGIHSARYLGHDTPYSEKNRIILERMKDAVEEERNAHYACSVAVVLPDGTDKVFTCTMEGRIALEPAGENGFGYDPIFFLPKLGKTSAQITLEEKNAISHRGKALRLMQAFLAEVCKA